MVAFEDMSAGAALVVLVLRRPWTVEMLANHIWSFAGGDGRQDINRDSKKVFGTGQRRCRRAATTRRPVTPSRAIVRQNDARAKSINPS